MKNSKRLMAAFAVLAAVSSAMAEDINIDFDAKGGTPASFSELLAGAGSRADNSAVSAVPDPEKAQLASNIVPPREIKIKVLMKNGAFLNKETVVCEAGKDGPALDTCKKRSDSAGLTGADITSLSLRKYFPDSASDFSALLEQTRHSYTNQSGPMTFTCKDACASWQPVSSESGCEISTSGAGCHSSVTSECVEFTHECECVKGC